MNIKHGLRKLAWKIGYDISRFTPKTHQIARRRQIFKLYEIDTVLDIGACSGQYALKLRSEIDYSKRILSFEPLRTSFELLKTNAKSDPAWEVFNFAIGDIKGKQEINIAAYSDCSSLLDMLPSHLKSAPNSKYIGKEIVEIKTIDSLFHNLCETAKNVYMKIDVQGFESKVLMGAENSLKFINTIQMEMSLISLYKGESLFNEMCTLMNQKGYTLIAIENGFTDPTTSQLLQVDGIFHRFV